MTNPSARANLPQIVAELQSVDPRALLIPARVLQRVVRFDRRLSTLEIGVPHANCYFISRERLLDFTIRYEYQLDLDRNLPETLLLFPAPEDDHLERVSAADLSREYWRLLFHVRVHLEFRRITAAHGLNNDRLLERLRTLGEIPFAEARNVMRGEELLLPPITYASAYTEFAATFLEHWYFAPELLPALFPGIRSLQQAADMLRDDFDHPELYRATQLPGARVSTNETRQPQVLGQVQSASTSNHATGRELNARTIQRWLARASRFDRVGNFIQAAILRQKIARRAPETQRADVERLAQDSLARFAERLCLVLGLPAGQEVLLTDALQPVLDRADRRFRQIETRLLYDLQKVCTEHDRGVYAIDLWRWIATAGKTPLRRPLPLLREVLVARHLKSARQKLQVLWLGSETDQTLVETLEACVKHARESLRGRVRPLIERIFVEEGCQPQNIVEVVAFKKIVEELLDRVVEHGQLSMGHLRDAISQSNIKLPDLDQVRELITGDQLLRIDRRLAITLDGVYHRGPIYLRMSHRLSSLAFGTRFGRIMTRYVALPFGGAYLVLESYRHILHFLFPYHTQAGVDAASHVPSAGDPTPVAVQPDFPLTTYSFVLVFGIFLMMLIESANVRGWCLRGIRRIGNFLVYLVRDLPELLLRLPTVRRIIDSPAYAACINYGFKPLVITTLLLLLIDRVGHWLPDRRIVSEEQMANVPKVLPFVSREMWWVLSFLAVNLFLNSPLGRYADALVVDNLRRGWRELRLKVFAVAFRFIVDSFQWMLRTIEQIIYSVDELLRFRSGEQWPMLVVKAVVGFFWSIISYLVRIYVTLLIEPQINPIKHFPVVTVSHKMILPFSIELTKLLATPLMPMGPLLANTIAGTTVFLLPGVFGFLAWELKENWRLYAANRSSKLSSIPIGSHGETMTRLLRPGFHSGTIPKLFARMRRAWHKPEPKRVRQGVIKASEKLHHVEHSIQVFIEREWISLLRELPEWRSTELRVATVRLATNEVECEISRAGTNKPLRVLFADLGGWLVVRVIDRGWSDELNARQRRAAHEAFRGVFRYAGVDLIWDQFVEGLGLPVEPYWYDFNRDGLQVWTQPRFDACVQYKLREMGATTMLSPPPKFVTAPRQEDLAGFVFSRSADTWDSWTATWNEMATESRDPVAIHAMP